MDEIITEILHVDSWQGVIVIVAGFAYLAWRDHKNSKKVENVKTQVDATNEAVAATASGVGAVLHQVENNSGTSLKDAVDRTEESITELAGKMDQHLELAAQESAVLLEHTEVLNELKARYLDPQ